MIKSGSLWVKVIVGLMLGLMSVIAVGSEADAMAQELSNQAPIPNAGADFSVNSSQRSFQLDGSINDPDHLLAASNLSHVPATTTTRVSKTTVRKEKICP